MNTLYTREGCPACEKAKELLSEQGMEFKEEIKPAGIVPVLVGGDSGDSFVLMRLPSGWRFVKGTPND